MGAMTGHQSRNVVTGERREKETFMRRSAEGRGKRIGNDTSLAAYPTAETTEDM